MTSGLKNKISFVLYEDKDAPKYFEIKKSTIKFFLIGLPFVAIITFVALVIIGLYFKQIRQVTTLKEPEIIKRLKQKNTELNKTLQETQKSNSSLLEKLASTEVVDDDVYSIFKQSPGRKDLTKNPSISLDNVSTVQIKNRVKIKFNLVNITPNGRRISGHIFIIMKFGNSLMFYPINSMQEDQTQISYNAGESFTTSRFRPVETTFPLNSIKASKLLYSVFVFSRTGDLLHKQLIQIDLKV